MPYGFPDLNIQSIWSHILDDTKKVDKMYYLYLLDPLINIGYYWISNNETDKQVGFLQL